MLSICLRNLTCLTKKDVWHVRIKERENVDVFFRLTGVTTADELDLKVMFFIHFYCLFSFLSAVYQREY